MEQNNTPAREGFGSRLGFILVSAGCAIGIGNVWKFPYVAGENGGAVFVLFYLLFLVLMGVPVMTMELAVGRASKKSVVGGFRALEPSGTRWHSLGWLCIAGNYILMMYYTTVSGWMLSYFYRFLTGKFDLVRTDEVATVFSDLQANPVEMTIFMALTVIVGFGILMMGVQNGLERVTKVMMLGLLVLIVVLAVHSVTLSGAGEGISFYLLPSWERTKAVGIGRVIAAAMSQAFFTLSLGIGSLEIFGSYMSKDNALTGEAVRICILDTFVAIISGLIIFPACFSYNVQPDQGPSLIFITLPSVFINMTGGRIWGTLFFVFMTFASFSTVTAVFENLIAILMDNLGWSRQKSILFNLIVILVGSLPCVLGFNVLSSLQLIGDRNVLDTEDFIVSNLLLPFGSLMFVLFCVTKAGWGFDKYLSEANSGAGMKMPRGLRAYLTFVLPLLILLILVGGLL